MAQFKTVITTAGAAKIAAAIAAGNNITLEKMAVGDGNGAATTPSASQTKLLKEVFRAALNSVSIDSRNTKNIVAEMTIPPETGGFWMREIGLYDADDLLIAVGNMAESYKPSLTEGAGRKSVLRMIIAVSDVSAITVTVDTTTVMASQDYVDGKISDHEKSRNHPDATLTQKGFTQLSSALDSASEGQAATPKAIKDVMTLVATKAPLESPSLTGTPTVPTAAPTDSSKKAANTEFVHAAIAAIVASSPAALDTLKELADALNNDPNFATTMLNALAGKQPKDDTLTALSGKDVAALLTYLGLGDAAKLGVATPADMQTGTATDLLTTVAAVMSIFSKRSFSQNDFIRIPDVPGGLMIQWGLLTGVSGSNVITSTLTFAELFPNACFAVVPIPLSGATGGGMCGVQVKTKTRSNADIFIYERDSGAIGAHDVPYIAIGG